MTKVLVLYYSTYGHIETMAYAVAEGAREVEGVEAVVKRVPELVPEEVAKQNHFKLDQPAPVATTAELPEYDAIIVGCGTRTAAWPRRCATSGTRPADCGEGLADRQGRLGLLELGHPARRQRDDADHRLSAFMHHGMIYVGLPYSCQEQMGVDEIKGGSPYGRPHDHPAATAAASVRADSHGPLPGPATWPGVVAKKLKG
jgi:NAD(P)H dehydrogenase (quinone)